MSSTTPPAAFIAACKRWACGNPTPADTAALQCLMLDTPLPPPFDPFPLGFDVTSRRPPAQIVHLFHSARDKARREMHARRTEAQRAQLHHLLMHSGKDTRGHNGEELGGLGAMPARAGALEAILRALGGVNVRWRVDEGVLLAALGLVETLRGWGWAVELDEEQGLCVVEWAVPQVHDWQLVKMGAVLGRGLDRSVRAGGEVLQGESWGFRGKGLGWWPRVWLWFVLNMGF